MNAGCLSWLNAPDDLGVNAKVVAACPGSVLLITSGVNVKAIVVCLGSMLLFTSGVHGGWLPV